MKYIEAKKIVGMSTRKQRFTVSELIIL